MPGRVHIRGLGHHSCTARAARQEGDPAHPLAHVEALGDVTPEAARAVGAVGQVGTSRRAGTVRLGSTVGGLFDGCAHVLILS